VEAVGRRYPHCLDLRVSTQFIDAWVGTAAVTLPEHFQDAGVGVCRCNQLHATEALDCRQNFCGSHTNTHYADAQFALAWPIQWYVHRVFLCRTPALFSDVAIRSNQSDLFLLIILDMSR
jgi:hypothetical protein